MSEQWLSRAIYGLTTLIGGVAFLYPFLVPALRAGESASRGIAHAADAPFLLTGLVALCFVVLLLEVQGQMVSAKLVALLGVLVAINSVLRFAEVAIPGPFGISPVFFLIALTGYVYGGRLGFLMGALTLLVSALLTGGLGPWLPYQMLTAGWIGMTAPLCRPLVRALRGEGLAAELAVLATFGAVWGLLYGVIMNIWFWPFATGAAAQSWQPGLGLADGLRRYLAFYLVTSFVWDVARAVGNVLLVALFGRATLRALRRFHRRFVFEYHPHPEPS